MKELQKFQNSKTDNNKKLRKVSWKKSKYSSNDKVEKGPNCYDCHKRCHYKKNFPKKRKE